MYLAAPLTSRVRERTRRDVSGAEPFVRARHSDDDMLGGQAEFPLDPLAHRRDVACNRILRSRLAPLTEREQCGVRRSGRPWKCGSGRP